MNHTTDPPPEGEEVFLTTAQVASTFRVDPKTVIRWGNASKISYSRTPGGHRRYRQSEITAQLAVVEQVAK